MSLSALPCMRCSLWRSGDSSSMIACQSPTPRPRHSSPGRVLLPDAASNSRAKSFSNAAQRRRRGDRVSLASAHGCCCNCSRPVMALLGRPPMSVIRPLSGANRTSASVRGRCGRPRHFITRNRRTARLFGRSACRVDVAHMMKAVSPSPATSRV